MCISGFVGGISFSSLTAILSPGGPVAHALTPQLNARKDPLTEDKATAGNKGRKKHGMF